MLPAPWWLWLVLVAATGAVAAALALFRRTRAQEETIRRMLASEESLKARLDDLFERSSEIVIVHDRRGRVSTINRAGEQVTGYLRDELRMLDPAWIFSNEYLDAITGLIADGAEAAPRTLHTEFVPRKGNRVPVEVQARVLVGDSDVIGVSTIARDLSERDRLENELRQAQKMEAVGRLASGIAHDFNNLITVLLGYSDELIEETPPGSAMNAAAVEVRRAADRASALTQQLLAFSRRQTSVAQSVDLNEVIARMEDLIRRLIGPEIRLEFSLQPDLHHVNADAQQIEQVIMNLIVNARDAMSSRGTLTVETSNVTLGAEHIDVIPGPHVELSISDTGIGMTSEVQERLFEPFFTTKDTGRGTGLGLSMVQAIVRQGGGHVSVDSRPGQGTTFRVYLPQQVEIALPAAPAASPAAAATTTVRGEGVILLAEDDRSVRRLVTAEMSRRGFQVLEADDGVSALEAFKREHDRIDVLVTDVVMPRMNGADLAKACERLHAGVKMLFISGHPERAGAGLDPTGVTNLLMKPFTADTLAARVKELITGKKAVDGWTL